MRVLVTGSEGLIGQRLAPLLRDSGHEVRTFDRVAQHRDMPGEHISGDLRDVHAVRHAMSGIDVILHLGAIASDRPAGDDEVLAVNTQGTWNVLLAGAEAGVERVIYFSSINALGCVGGGKPAHYLPLDDAHPRMPTSPYQLSKHLAEETCLAFTRKHGLITLCLRPVGVLVGDHGSRLREVAPDLRAEWERAEYWAYVDVRDVCDAALRALTANGVDHGAFLLSADDTTMEIPTASLVTAYHPALSWKPPGRESWLAANPYRTLIDCSAAKQILGWSPQQSWRTTSVGNVDEEN